MMAQNFGRMVRKNNRRGSEQGQSSSTSFRNWKSSRPRSSETRQELSDKGREEVQCHECKGFGHIQSQCANTLMKKKAMVASISDSNSSDTVPEQLELPVDNLSDSDDEELTQESLAQTYKDLYKKWLLLINVNQKLNDTVASVTAEKDQIWQGG
ncbi:unnamed protein product [Rhodiola kirilowii]